MAFSRTNRRVAGFLAPLAMFLVVQSAAAAADPTALSSADVLTSIDLNMAHLTDMGVAVTGWRTSSRQVVQHPLSVVRADAPVFEAVRTDMRFLVADGRFDGSVEGALTHQGGFTLGWGKDSMSLLGFQLRAGVEPRSYELLSADGKLIFTADMPHYAVDPERGVVQIFSADLRISRYLAKRMGQPAVEGVAVGVMAVTARASVPAVLTPPACGDWTGSQDVALLNIGSIGESARANGLVVATPSASLKNVGIGNVPWQSKFSTPAPPYNLAQHPMLVWSMFKIKPDAIHMLGVSGVKHAYLTLNNNCDPGACTDSHVLGTGCEDTYSQGTNKDNNSLGPRDEIHPGVGRWAHCSWPNAVTPSHFDTNGDCNQDYFGGGEDAFSHGLALKESDLTDPTAEYRFYAWYIVRDDINIFNTMGHRRVNPQFGTTWTFSFLSALRPGSPIDSWVDPAAPSADQRNETLATPDGHVQVAVKVSDLGGGIYHYEYAVFNHDLDNALSSFSLPLGAGAAIGTTMFRDVDSDASNDWQATVTTSSIQWNSPASAMDLKWGTLYNFGFDVNVAPVDSSATLGSGTPATTYGIPTIAPGLAPLDLLRHAMTLPLDPVSMHLPLEAARDFYAVVSASPVNIPGDVILQAEPVVFYGVPSATRLFVTKGGNDAVIRFEM